MSREFSFIKPFRALAAFWVISAHCFQWWGPYVPAYFPHPKMSVDLFMIISGYLMAANAFARDAYEPLSQGRNWLRFWMRRFFRVAPAYYVTLTLVILLSNPVLSGYQTLIHMMYGNSLVGTHYDPALVSYSLDNILMHVSFLFGIFPDYASSTYLPDWSLGLEMQFYFVFPFLFLFVRRFSFLIPSAVIGFGVFVLGMLLSKHVYYPEPSVLVLKLNYFIAGMVLYRLLAGGISREKSAAMALLAIALVSLDYQRYHRHMLVLPALMCLMMFLGYLEIREKTPRWVASVIGSRVVEVAADTSYSVYLFHGYFVAIVGLAVAGNEGWVIAHPQAFNWMLYAFVITGAYTTASLVYRFVELPGISLGKRVIDRVLPLKRDGAAPVASTPAVSN